MKKYLSILVLGLAVMLPISANAASTKKVDWSCDNKTCNDTGTDTCQRTCTLGLSGDLKQELDFSATLELSDGVKKIVSITTSNGWESKNDAWKNGGKSIPLSFINPAGVTGSKSEIATIVVEVDKNATCNLKLIANGSTQTVTVKKEETVNTGATLPMVIIASLALISGAVYVISKKNTKMYKI